MQKKIIALVDCDSFFCSCERVFNPKVRHIPVVVLSNNDGCVVSRSREAKALGVPMGAPYFKIKNEYERQGGVAFSSNFALYGDLSARVMSILAEFTPDLEVYSIDEAFLDLSDLPHVDIEALCNKVRMKILKEVGIPVSIGVATSKVLAKVATSLAKKRNEGFCYIKSEEEKNYILKKFPVENLWGIGKASHLKLKALNIKMAYDLMIADTSRVLKTLTIVGAKIQEELKGNSIIDLGIDRDNRKQILVSRSFEEGLYELEEIQKRLSDHVFKASEIMREENLVCYSLDVFIMTNRFKDLPQYYNHYQIKNNKGESAPHVLTKKALEGLGKIFKYGYEYKKCGVVLSDFKNSNQKQLSFLEVENPSDEKLTQVIDQINRKYGHHAIKIMSGTTDQDKINSQTKRSGRYTSEWDELKTLLI